MKTLLRFAFLVSLLLVVVTNTFAQRRGTGDNTTAEEYQRIPKAAPRATRDLTDLPPSFSLKQYTPPVQDQGELSTCVGWSTAYAARTISYAILRNFTDRDSIIKYSFSPFHLYNRIRSTNDMNCMGGASLVRAATTLKDKGILRYSDYSLKCSPADPVTDEESKAIPFRIKDYLALSDLVVTKNDILRIKKSLTEKKPVVISIRCFQSFWYVKTDGFWNQKPNDNAVGNHAMCVIGYNDSIAGGAFEVMNSYGTNWGNKGFCWITYEQLMQLGNKAVQMMDIEEPAVLAGASMRLAGGVEFVQLDGSTMPVKRTRINTRSIDVEDDERADFSKYRFVENYPGGTAFKIKFTTNAPAYVYIISQDDKQVISKLFPYSPTISAAINSNNETVYLPSETKHARLSSKPGKENICVLYSKQAIDFDELVNYLKKSKKPIAEVIKSKFLQQLIQLDKINFSDDNIAFQAAARNDKLICFFIELEHH